MPVPDRDHKHSAAVDSCRSGPIEERIIYDNVPDIMTDDGSCRASTTLANMTVCGPTMEAALGNVMILDPSVENGKAPIEGLFVRRGSESGPVREILRYTRFSFIYPAPQRPSENYMYSFKAQPRCLLFRLHSGRLGEKYFAQFRWSDRTAQSVRFVKRYDILPAEAKSLEELRASNRTSFHFENGVLSLNLPMADQMPYPMANGTLWPLGKTHEINFCLQ